MDPITLTIAIVAALGGGGLTTAAIVSRRRRRRHQAMRKAVRAQIPCGPHSPVTLFDLFWDLGASEYALAMMAHRDLLLDEAQDTGKLIHTLGEEVVRSGGYSDYVAEQLEAIEEIVRDHAAGKRLALPALVSPQRKMLAPAGGNLPVKYENVVGGVDDRGAWRAGTTTGPLDSGQAIDIEDAVGNAGQRLLRSLFSGSITAEAKRWFALRDARKMRSELDERFVELHRLYAQHVRPDPTVFHNLHDASRRWEAEVNRLGALLQAKAYASESWGLCAQCLLEEASDLAVGLAQRARIDVDATLHRIDELAASDDESMAGYLVYVNRYALFVGRMQLCDAVVGQIESSLARLSTELAELQRKGVL